jgi:riboflavin kinase/FMN adenylyltransferase
MAEVKWVKGNAQEIGRPDHQSIPSVVTIGNFDGVHRGHQELFQRACSRAREIGGRAVVFTFRPHPRAVLQPEVPLDLLLTYDEKLEVISRLGVDGVVEEPFSREFSTLDPPHFFREWILKRLNTKEVIVGYDFKFGRERSGSLESLRAECEAAGVTLHVISPFDWKGERVSSSLIRTLLKSAVPGALTHAADLLSRPYFYRGIVRRGDGRGHQLGFPTANLQVDNKLLLPRGVYVTQAIDTRTGESYPSVTNFGVRPTFVESKLGVKPVAVVECHLLDVTRDLYGSPLEVRFLEFLRPEKKFEGVSSLLTQIQLDVDSARKWFATHSSP